MSTNVLSYGYMAPLVTPIKDRAEREELSERLYEESRIRLNYEGTLVYIDVGDREEFFGGLFFTNPDHLTLFHQELAEVKLEITHEVKPYFAVWYNGTDSYMDDMKLEDFLKEEGSSE